MGHRYVYNSKNQLVSEINRFGITTEYTYNDVGAKVREEFDIYEFNYLPHGELSNVKVAGEEKVSYNYDNNYNLTEKHYANEDKIRYEYNENGKVSALYHNNDDSPYVTYTYNTDNKLTEKVNTDIGLKYVYGENGQISVFKTSDNSLVQSYTEQETEADEEAGTEGFKTVNETHFGTSYSSVVKDKSVLYSSNDNTVEYSYQTSKDDDEKMSTDMIKNGDITALSAAYEYDKDGNVTKKTYSCLDNIEQASIDIVNRYDDEGKIIGYGYSGIDQEYFYDENEQIIRVNDNIKNPFTETYSYDERGNITSKKTYNYTENETIAAEPVQTTSFTYANTGWRDQLVSVNGVELTYDANGNVLTYGDRNYTWNSGRHLESISDGENTYSYKYDEKGIRTSKTVNGNTTYYNTLDGVILSQSDETNTMYFQYNTNGVPIGFVYNGIQYFYLTNAMGDVIGITEANGNNVVIYFYDAWGRITAIDTADEEGETTYLELANANPLRYRGYYYDSETGYYYLQSRYYDPNICRFINSDVIEISIISKDLAYGINLYSYSSNNPINSVDYLGLLAETIFGIPIGLFALAVFSGLAFVFIILYAVVTAIENAPAISFPSFSYATPAEKADTKIKDTIKNPQGYKYWLATINDDYVSISLPLSYDTAFTLALLGTNIFAINKLYAYDLAFDLSVSKPIGPERHGESGYYWHYHPNPKNGSHIFYI